MDSLSIEKTHHKIIIILTENIKVYRNFIFNIKIKNYLKDQTYIHFLKVLSIFLL